MADKKISELTTITGANTASGDLFVIVDVDANETKKITRDELTNALELTDFDNIDINGGTIDGVTIGGASAGAGTFTTITGTGLTVNSTGTAIDLRSNNNAGSALNVLRFTDTDASAGAGQELGKIEFYSSDASTPGAGVKAEIVGIAEVGNPGGGLAFRTDLLTGSPIERMRIDRNGDISFYEPTGTTPKLFWDSSAESLGIGNVAPSAPLTVGVAYGGTPNSQSRAVLQSTTNTYLTLGAGTASEGGILFADSADNDVGGIFYSHNTNAMTFRTGAGSRMSIDSSGNLLVGKTSSGYSVNGAEITSTGLLYLPAGSASAPSLTFSGDTNTGIGFGGADILYFTTGGTERARIDASGTLLVGKTTDSVATAGTALFANGSAHFVRDGDFPVFINRITSDGELIRMRKDNGTIGTISADGGDLTIGTGNTGLRFLNSSSTIIPRNTDLSTSDNVLSLGDASNRFQDLYLSGSVYLGGTTSANALDDYEEGTFTCTIVDDTSGLTLSDANTTAKYTKIGDLVHIEIHAPTFQNQANTGAVKITSSAPFASAAPAVLFAGGNMRGFDATTRDSNPVVVVAGGDRTQGGSGMYTLLANEGSNISGYDANDGAWNRDGGFNAPGLFIQGSYKVA